MAEMQGDPAEEVVNALTLGLGAALAAVGLATR